MQNQNHGVLVSVPNPKDYILGSSSPIVINRVVKDQSIYLPMTETQHDTIVDFLDCVTFSGGHSIEMQLNYLMATNQLSDEALTFFHNNNYIVNGVFRISKRFSAKMNGTDLTKGQYLNVAAESFRVNGFIPDSMWSMTPGMTWEEYYKPIPQNLIDLGKKALWYISIQYQWTTKDTLVKDLIATPIQCATEVCAGWDSGQVVPMCSGQPLAHATIIYGQDGSLNWKDFDQYSPFTQLLSNAYELPLNMQYWITVKPLTLRVGMIGMNVIQLQEDLRDLGYNIQDDGSFGPLTQTAVKNFQSKEGLVTDGIAGLLTLTKIKDILKTPVLNIKDIITSVCNKNGIEPELGIAVASCESGLNPNSKLYNPGSKSTDRGLVQINNVFHPEVSDAQAFDPTFSMTWFCNAVKGGNLHAYWSASQHCWAPKLSPSVRQKYGV